MNKSLLRTVALAAAATAALSLTGCNSSAKKPAKSASQTHSSVTATPGQKLEGLNSATLGEPSQIRPNAGAMAECDDNRIKVRGVNGTPSVKLGFKALKGAAGEDCIVRVGFDAGKNGSKGLVLALATERGLHVSGIFAQSSFMTGPKQFSDITVPDDATLTLLFQNAKRPAGMQPVTNKNEEPNSRAVQVANVPAFRQLVGLR